MRIRLYDVTRITRTGLVPHSAIDAASTGRHWNVAILPVSRSSENDDNGLSCMKYNRVSDLPAKSMPHDYDPVPNAWQQK